MWKSCADRTPTTGYPVQNPDNDRHPKGAYMTLPRRAWLSSMFAVLLLAACDRTTNYISAPTTPTPIPTGTADDLVEYRVLGDSETLSGVLVRLSNSVDGLSQQRTVLPFFQALNVNRDSVFLSLDARGAGTGFLYVGIFVNGVMFREASSTVTNPFVAVSGTYHRQR